MNISLKERKSILNWFDIAVEVGNLKDSDLRLYDKIRESLDYEEDDNEDPLLYHPKKSKNDEYSDESDNSEDDVDLSYRDEDLYEEEY